METGLQSNSSNNDRPWLYKKGQSGNPSGKPKGAISLKTYVRNRLATMTAEEKEEFLDAMPKQDIWKMAEGAPESKTEIKVDNTIMFTEAELEAAKELISKRLNEKTIDSPKVE